MQAKQPTRISRADSAISGQARRTAETGASPAHAPEITITKNALRYIFEMRERLGLPVKGIRVRAIPRSPLRADFAMSFVPAEEPDSPTDFIQSTDDLDIHIPLESAPYLKDASIDLVFRIIGSELKVLAPLRQQDTPDGRIAAKIQGVLDEVINPSLGTHGGGATLIDYKDGVVFVELTGGCQGCSMAGATLKEGIETSIRQALPEVVEVRDVTNHANGSHPYFQ